VSRCLRASVLLTINLLFFCLEETVQQYDCETYFGHFRISRHLTTRITDLYRESNYFKKNRHGQFGKIPADDQVGSVLVQFMYIVPI